MISVESGKSWDARRTKFAGDGGGKTEGKRYAQECPTREHEQENRGGPDAPDRPRRKRVAPGTYATENKARRTEKKGGPHGRPPDPTPHPLRHPHPHRPQ